MTEGTLRELLEAVRRGDQSIDEAVVRLRALPFEDVGFAKLDHHRALRCGFPEVIYGEGKTPEQLSTIVERRRQAGGAVLVTRASRTAYDHVLESHPDAVYHELPRLITLGPQPQPTSTGTIAIVAAGTSDLHVAEEARVTAEMMEQRTQTIYDVGVAGLHRLLMHTTALQSAAVAVVVAGMEGALASVVGGLVSCPVVAVPTSVGYGASFQGLSALLTMLNSCAAGVTVVNIDNGFGAGYAASLINRMGEGARYK